MNENLLPLRNLSRKEYNRILSRMARKRMKSYIIDGLFYYDKEELENWKPKMAGRKISRNYEE